MHNVGCSLTRWTHHLYLHGRDQWLSWTSIPTNKNTTVMFKFAMFDSLLMGKPLSFFSPEEPHGALEAIVRRAQDCTESVGFHYYLLGYHKRLDPATDASAIPDGAVVVLYHDHHSEMLLDQVHSTFSRWVDASIPYHDKYKKIPAPVQPSTKKDPVFPRCKEAYDALLHYLDKGHHDAVDILLGMDPSAMRALLQSYSTPCTSLPKGKERADLCVTYDFRPVSAYSMEDAEKHIGWVVVKRDLFSDTVHRQGKEKELRSADQQIVRVGLGSGEEALGALTHCACCNRGKFVHLVTPEGSRKVRTRAIDRCLVLEEHYYGRVRVDMYRFPLNGDRVLLWARLVYDGIGTLYLPELKMRLTGFFDQSDFVFGRKTRQGGLRSVVQEGGFGRQCRLRGFGVSTERGATKTLHPCVRGLDPGQVWSSTSGLFDDRCGVQKGLRRVFMNTAVLYAYDGTFVDGRENVGVLRILNPEHGHLAFDGKFSTTSLHKSAKQPVTTFRGKVQSLGGGDRLFAVGTFNDMFEPEGECFVRQKQRCFSGTFRRGSLAYGSLHDTTGSLRGTFEPLKERENWPGKPKLVEGVMDTKAFTARGTFTGVAKHRIRIVNGMLLDRVRGLALRFRKGRVDVRPQAKVIQSWWRTITGERRTRGWRRFLGGSPRRGKCGR